jgi:hypothetical protein
VAAASNPAVTDYIADTYARTVDERNTRRHLELAFHANPLEFVDALLLPTVIATLRNPEFRQAQDDALLFAAVVDAATRGFPSARLTDAPLLARSPVPLGFLNRRDYNAFTRELSAGLQRAGYDDATVFFRGSSVTGVRYRGGSPFDYGYDSDLDLAVVSPTAFARAQGFGIRMRAGGTRTPPLDDGALRRLGLLDDVDQLNGRTGRTVSIMLYRSVDDVLARGANIPVPHP